MPLFTFCCATCEAEQELLVRGAEEPECPKCGSRNMVKQLAHFAPMHASAGADLPVGCGASQCCQLQGGCTN